MWQEQQKGFRRMRYDKRHIILQQQLKESPLGDILLRTIKRQEEKERERESNRICETLSYLIRSSVYLPTEGRKLSSKVLLTNTKRELDGWMDKKKARKWWNHQYLDQWQLIWAAEEVKGRGNDRELEEVKRKKNKFPFQPEKDGSLVHCRRRTARRRDTLDNLEVT